MPICPHDPGALAAGSARNLAAGSALVQLFLPAPLQKLPVVRVRCDAAYSARRETPPAAIRHAYNSITQGKWSRPVSRVLSRTIIPLESPSPATSSGLPGSTGGHPLPLAGRLPYLALLQVGFAVPSNVATDAVRSYRTVSPLPASLLTLRRFVFCCTFRRLTPPRRYLAPCPQEPGLSSTFREKCSDRPADSARTIATCRPHHKPAFPGC